METANAGMLASIETSLEDDPMVTMDRSAGFRAVKRRGAIHPVAWLVSIPLAAAAWAAPHEPTAAPASEVPAAEEAGVQAAIDAFVGAWVAEDEEAVVSAFLPDAVAHDPVPPGTFEGHEGIRQWVKGSFENLEGIAITSPEAMTIETLGQVAWVSGSYRFEAIFGDQDIVDEGPLSMVWVRQPDGAYRLALFHASKHPEAAGAEPAVE